MLRTKPLKSALPKDPLRQKNMWNAMPDPEDKDPVPKWLRELIGFVIIGMSIYWIIYLIQLI